MVNRKSGRKAPQVARFDASYVPVKKTRGTKASKKAGKAKPAPKPGPKSLKTKARAAPREPRVDETDYEVESIWGVRRASKYYDDIEVLIKWVGYEEPTWEPLENAQDSKDLMKPFRRAVDRIGGNLKLKNEDDRIADDVADDDTEGGNDYEVEDIIGVQYSKENGRIEYSVKWKGYSYRECTWEPLENVDELPEYLEFFQEAVDSLVADNNVGMESRRTPARKRKAGDSESENTEQNGADGSETVEEEEQETGDEVPAPKRGRKSKPGLASSKKASNGRARRSRH